MAKLTDKLFNRVIEGKFVAQSGDELPKELPAVSAVDNGKALVVSGGKWVAGTISGGTQFYQHSFTANWDGDICPIVLVTNSNVPITTVDILKSQLVVAGYVQCVWIETSAKNKDFIGYHYTNEEVGGISMKGLLFVDSSFSDPMNMNFNKLSSFTTDTVTPL